MSIKWEEGAVCFCYGRQWPAGCIELFHAIGGRGDTTDLQLNEIREGDYIESSELDSEQKYNDAVEAFKLLGFEWGGNAVSRYSIVSGGSLTCFDDGLWKVGSAFMDGKRKITYPQLMAIGKLKRAMIERDDVDRGKLKHSVRFSDDEIYAIVSGKSVDTASAGRRNKSKQAYDILKSLDYEYDLNKQKWYKKEWV